MQDQLGKFERFKALHERESAFVIPNPWDAGSARLLANLGFEALATTSAGYAFSKGKRDSFASLERGEILTNAAEIVGATDLPVSADLEDGFGAKPETCAETIRLASALDWLGARLKTPRAILLRQSTTCLRRWSGFRLLLKRLALSHSC
jgi:2-methylisocitrate lyase-like PEP mutase family enzyme